jgi:AraC-like DNA-binding protein
MTEHTTKIQLAYGIRDEEWGIYCTEVGSIYKLKPQEIDFFSVLSTVGRVLNEYQFFYCTAGQGVYRHPGGEMEIKEGSFITILPNVRHWIIPGSPSAELDSSRPDERWSAVYVTFDGRLGRTLIGNKSAEPTSWVRSIGVREPIVSAFRRLRDIAEVQGPFFQNILGSIVLEIFAYTLSYEGSQVHDRAELEILEKAKAILTESLYRRLDMEQVAESLGVSYKAFGDLFRSYLGMTPYQYFLNLKINKAKELLASGSYSVKEVSYKLAFQTPYYFSRFFKIKTGTAPSKWNGLDLEDI